MLAFAISDNRAVLTLNRQDFIRLHRANYNHCGIVICTNDMDRSRMAIRINQAIAQEEDLASQLIRVVLLLGKQSYFNWSDRISEFRNRVSLPKERDSLQNSHKNPVSFLVE